MAVRDDEFLQEVQIGTVESVTQELEEDKDYKLGLKDHLGNSALILAQLSSNFAVAKHLIAEDPSLCFEGNNEYRSGLQGPRSYDALGLALRRADHGGEEAEYFQAMLNGLLAKLNKDGQSAETQVLITALSAFKDRIVNLGLRERWGNKWLPAVGLQTLKTYMEAFKTMYQAVAKFVADGNIQPILTATQDLSLSQNSFVNMHLLTPLTDRVGDWFEAQPTLDEQPERASDSDEEEADDDDSISEGDFARKQQAVVAHAQSEIWKFRKKENNLDPTTSPFKSGNIEERRKNEVYINGWSESWARRRVAKYEQRVQDDSRFAWWWRTLTDVVKEQQLLAVHDLREKINGVYTAGDDRATAKTKFQALEEFIVAKQAILGPEDTGAGLKGLAKLQQQSTFLKTVNIIPAADEASRQQQQEAAAAELRLRQQKEAEEEAKLKLEQEEKKAEEEVKLKLEQEEQQAEAMLKLEQEEGEAEETPLTQEREEEIEEVKADTRTHYEVLGIDNKASEKQIKKAYYAKCLDFKDVREKTLPTSHPRSIELSKIQAAHDTLMNKKVRNTYDQSLDIAGLSPLKKSRDPAASSPINKKSVRDPAISSPTSLSAGSAKTSYFKKSKKRGDIASIAPKRKDPAARDANKKKKDPALQGGSPKMDLALF